MARNLYCDDIQSIHLFRCCDGCHDEEFLGFGDYMETELPNGKTLFHCCGLLDWVKDPDNMLLALALSNGSEPAEAPSNSGESH